MPRATIGRYAQMKLSEVHRKYVDSITEKAMQGQTDAYRELKELAATAKGQKAARKVVPIHEVERSDEATANIEAVARAETPAKAPRRTRAGHRNVQKGQLGGL